MKFYLFSFLIFMSLSSFANLEHKDGMEGRPTTARQEMARSCFDELEIKGCGHPSRDKKFFRDCIKEHESDLSDNCKSLMRKLYGKRS